MQEVIIEKNYIIYSLLEQTRSSTLYVRVRQLHRQTAQKIGLRLAIGNVINDITL